MTVPDEVLYPDRSDVPAKDMSWLEALPLFDEPEDEPARPAPAPVVARKVVAKTATAAPKPVKAERPEPNAEPEGRPPFPYGWLVIVEGPGTGKWFPLERGASAIGGGDGQTVRLDFGDSDIKADRQVLLTYDETRHSFVAESTSTFRVNGEICKSERVLRDGDVFTIGATSLRIVALCSRNFHWAEHIAAE